MSDHCFVLKIKSSFKDDIGDYYEQLETYVQSLFTDNERWGDSAFSEEKLPLDIYMGLLSKEHKIICIKLTSRAKENIKKFKEIISGLTDTDLKPDIKDEDDDIIHPFTLTLPYVENLCNIERYKLGKKDKKWTTLSHNGPYFGWIMEPYEPYNASFIYKNKKYLLEPEEEECAVMYARRIITEETSSKKLLGKEEFNDNFWSDFREYLTDEHKEIFKHFKNADFSEIVEAIKERKIEKESFKKNESKTDKQKRRIKNLEKKINWGMAYVNDSRTPLNKFAVEPPSLFIGGGVSADLTRAGKIKPKILPSDVILNLGESDIIPLAPKGYKWKGIEHDHTHRWTAKYKNPVSGKNAYTRLQESSELLKFEYARKLEVNHDQIVDAYNSLLNSSDVRQRQLGTVIYLIDTAGIRVGNESDKAVSKDEEIVGATTLHVGQIKFLDNKIIQFNFPGKDGVMNTQKLKVSKQIYNNLQEFSENDNKIFDRLDSTVVNNFLHSIDKNFTAKVFRTRLASKTMYEYLKENCDIDKDETLNTKFSCFRLANREVAIKLNHMKTPTPAVLKTFEKAQKKYEDTKDKMSEEKKEIELEKIQIKEQNLTVALGTSLKNYIDPRVIKSWALKTGMAEPNPDDEENPSGISSKIYTKVLRTQFLWALDDDDVDDKWDYLDAEFTCVNEGLEPLSSEDKIVSEEEQPKEKSKKQSKEESKEEKITKNKQSEKTTKELSKKQSKEESKEEKVIKEKESKEESSKSKIIKTVFLPLKLNAIIYPADKVKEIQKQYNIQEPIKDIPMYLLDENTLLINDKLYPLLLKTKSI